MARYWMTILPNMQNGLLYFDSCADYLYVVLRYIAVVVKISAVSAIYSLASQNVVFRRCQGLCYPFKYFLL